MAIKISIKTGDGLKINKENKNLEIKHGKGLVINNNKEVEASLGEGLKTDAINRISLNTGKGFIYEYDMETQTNKVEVYTGRGLKYDNGGAIEVVGNEDKGIIIDNENGVEVKGNSNKGINVEQNGVEVKVDNITTEFDENGNLKTIGQAPDITAGNGIEFERQEGSTNITIKAKGGNGISVGENGITANTSRGVNIQSNQIGLNANFTESDTPLGNNPSNITKHSDGKISIPVGGGGGDYTAGSGIDITNNTIKLNANFTESDTPLGDNPSNITKHSDGKISFDSSSSGKGIKLYIEKSFQFNIPNTPSYYNPNAIYGKELCIFNSGDINLLDNDFKYNIEDFTKYSFLSVIEASIRLYENGTFDDLKAIGLNNFNCTMSNDTTTLLVYQSYANYISSQLTPFIGQLILRENLNGKPNKTRFSYVFYNLDKTIVGINEAPELQSTITIKVYAIPKE